jgi:dTDP-4-dehydrorhamnose 3,5-epimerase
MLAGARKDPPTVTAEGRLIRRGLAGVEVRESCNIVTRNGLTTEVYRADWGLAAPVAQTLCVSLRAHAVSAWHCHERQLDRVFVVAGSARLVLYDDRDGSPTRGQLDELLLDRARPTLVTIPPGIWHGMQNLGAAECTLLNFFDRVYDHAAPDEWRLPSATDAIPYRFQGLGGDGGR